MSKRKYRYVEVYEKPDCFRCKRHRERVIDECTVCSVCAASWSHERNCFVDFIPRRLSPMAQFHLRDKNWTRDDKITAKNLQGRLNSKILEKRLF